MSENLSFISARSGVRHNLLERMTDEAMLSGMAETPEFMHRLGGESLFGDACTAGAVFHIISFS